MTHKTVVGSAIVYALSIPNTATNKAGGIDFVGHLMGFENTENLLQAQGLYTFPDGRVFYGNQSAVPAALRE
jgi:ABC-type molybdate transport system substrate-binding protein